jgi:predicted amidophosphoribosyltransferase
MRCLSCQYDLRKLAKGRCPECGREFDPKNRRTFLPEADVETKKGDRHFWIGVAVLLLCLSPIAIIVVIRILGSMSKMP